MVPADSQQISRARCYLGTRSKRDHTLSTTGLSPSTADHSRPLRLACSFLTRLQHGSTRQNDPTTPHAQPLPSITCAWFSLIRFRSPLLTESQLFSLPMGTEMFHFPTFPPHRLYIQRWVTRHHSCWVSPFGHPRITARLTAPRGLSQPPTSFIGSWYQGIHRTPLHTYNNTYTHTPTKQPTHECRRKKHKCLQKPFRNCSTTTKTTTHECATISALMLASTMQFSNNTHRPTPTPQQPKLHKQAETSQHQETTTGTKHHACSLRTPIVCNKPPPPHENGASTQPAIRPTRAYRLFDVSPMSTRRRTSACETGHHNNPEQGPLRAIAP